jgi:hypothetical protein
MYMTEKTANPETMITALSHANYIFIYKVYFQCYVTNPFNATLLHANNLDGGKVWSGSPSSGQGLVAGSCEHSNELPSSIKGR